MANTLALSTALPTGPSNGVQPLGGSGGEVIGTVVFQITAAAGGFSTIPRAVIDSIGTAATGQNIVYTNVLTGAVVAAGTAITSNGIYAVFSPGCFVELITSAGTATVDWNVVLGRV